MSYKVIDPLIATFSGAIVASAAAHVLPAEGGMLLGMLAGGLIGMAAQFILMIPLMILFGAFEVMIPLGLIAMPAGMVGGMAATQAQIPDYCAASAGGALGFVIAAIVSYSNQKSTQVE